MHHAQEWQSAVVKRRQVPNALVSSCIDIQVAGCISDASSCFFLEEGGVWGWVGRYARGGGEMWRNGVVVRVVVVVGAICYNPNVVVAVGVRQRRTVSSFPRPDTIAQLSFRRSLGRR